MLSIYACGGGGESSNKTETIIEVQKQQSTNLVFADQNLTDCVQALIDSQDYTLVEEIKQLECPGKEIKDIEGIQNLSSLEVLNLSNNQIRDITPISKLGKLKQLNLQDNNLQLLSSISENQLLEQVDISDNSAIICSEQTKLEQSIGEENLIANQPCIEGMQQAQDVTFEDDNLQACIRQTALDIGADHLEQIQQLKCVNHAIDNIVGINQLPNLRELDLTQNNISDITPLQGLTLLKKVLLGKNQISNAQPLIDSKYMQELRLDYNELTDIQAAQTLKALRQIHLTNNQIRDLTPLQSLTGLLELRISNNRIIDIDSLANLPKLSSLWIQGNQIADLTPLQSLQNLEQLWLSNNWLTDLTPLQTQSRLKWLHLDGTEAADLQPLNKLTQLKWLQLDNTRVDDITAIYPLTKLDWLHLKGNNTIPCSQLDQMEEIITAEKIDRPETCSQPQEQTGNPISTIEFQDQDLKECVYDAAREQGITNAEELTTLSCPSADITDITGILPLLPLESIDLTGNDHISCEQLDQLQGSIGEALIRPEQCNLPPTVAAQQEQTVETGTKVDLNAEATDPNGDSLTYNWQQTAGQNVQLTNQNTATPSFTAPQGEDQTITLQLTVTDQYGLSTTQTINILVTGVIFGSKDNPFLVTNYEDLKKVGTGIDGWNLDSHYLQTADIDATPSKTENPISDTEEEYYGFEPIGTEETPFTGGYDGGGLTIYGLTINRPEQGLIGLFGFAVNATFNSISLANMNIIGEDFVGGLVGLNHQGVVSNNNTAGNLSSVSNQEGGTGGLIGVNRQGEVIKCYSSAKVTAPDVAGGLVGVNIEGVIDTSFAIGDVAIFSSSNGDMAGYAGGLVGLNIDLGTIRYSYATGNVTGKNFYTNEKTNEGVGGLVGRNHSLIVNSYSHGEVSGYKNVGGLVGQMNHYEGNDNKPATYSIITNSYSTGQVQLQNEDSEPVDFGGLVGFSTSELNTVTNSFWDIETSGQEVSAGGKPKTSEELKTTTTFTNAGWDFDQTWMILSKGYTYPRLAWNTIEVNSWTDLNNMRNNLHANYVLTRDLLTADADYVELAGPDANDGKGWEPVGTSENPFMGTFDGGGFAIDGLTINKLEEPFVGMFGFASDSHYTNINLMNTFVHGNIQVGAIVGYSIGEMENTVISNSSVSGVIYAKSGYAGGLAGWMVGARGGSLLNSSVVGNVSTGNNHAGGLVGMMIGSNLNVSESFFDGKVIGRVDVGGLIGQAVGTDAVVNIKESYAKGVVEWEGDRIGADYIGGLVGRMDGDRVSIEVVDSYSMIDIIINDTFGEYVGGIVGYVDGQSVVFKNINARGLIDIKGHGVYVGGIAGRAFSGLEAKNCYADVDISIAEFGQQVGGFIGFFGGNIEESYASGDINVFSRGLSVGGFGGRISYGNILKSYATGSIFVAESEEKTLSIGGFAGEAGSGEYNNVYATGDVIAPDAEAVGGLFGLGAADIINSYSVGLVEGATDVGGFVGVGGGEITNSFWDTETSGQSISAGGTGLPTAEMQTKTTFTDVGWDFADVWVMRDYPEFQWDSIAISNIEFVDTALRDCVLETAEANGWTQSTQVTNLNCSDLGITDTTGLEQLTEITDLDLIGNNHISCDQLDDLQNDIGEQGINRPEQCNLPPTISAEEQTVTAGAQVNLTAEVVDPNGDSLTYNWQQTGGQIVDLTNPDTAAATFTAPEDGEQTLSFQLTVTDPYGLSVVQSINISVIAVVLGTKDNPFLVTSYEDLKKVGTGTDGWNLDSHYLQTADIDASPSKTENQIPDTEGEYYGFAPIGNSDTPFTGGYDGGDFIIDGLTINRSEQNFVGLFGSAADAFIHNINQTNISVIGDNQVGGIVGKISSELSNIEVSQSSISGSVKGMAYVGCISGLIDAVQVKIVDDFASCDVAGSFYVGGLAGYIASETTVIENSSSEGTVIGEITMIGGLVGELTGSSSILINKSYATGSISVGNDFDQRLGGLFGFIGGDSISLIDSYSNGDIEVLSEQVVQAIGGIIGYATSNIRMDIKNCSADRSINLISRGATSVGGFAGSITSNGGDFELSGNVAAGDVSFDSDGGVNYVGGFAGLIGGKLNASDNSSTGNIFIKENEETHAQYIGGHFGSVAGTGVISNSFAIGNIEVNTGSNPSFHMGGFAGVSTGVDLDKVRAAGNLVGKTTIGGLVGLFQGNLSESFSTGNVSGESNIGGLVGYNKGLIYYSYARGSVTGNSQVGGLVGQMAHYEGDDENPATYSSITNSYSTGQVVLQDEDVEPADFGGLVGVSTSELNTVSNSFWDIETSGMQTSTGGEPKTSEELKIATTFTNAGWDFDETWMILTEGYTYPRLAWNTVEVWSWTELQAVNQNLSANIVLMRDLLTTDADYAELVGPDADYGEVEGSGENTPKGWMPIGTEDNPFTGSFNGRQYVIDGLYIFRTKSFMGLFGYVADGEISNANLSNVNIVRSYASGVGSIAGANEGWIADSSATGHVSGNVSVGGLVGHNIGIIDNSYAEIEVIAKSSRVGGLVGTNIGTISASYATESVSSAGSWIGGIAGRNEGVVIRSFATSSVYGDGLIGGAVGANIGKIINCYATGDVDGTTSIGGLVGGSGSGVIENSYATGVVSGTQNLGGLIGDDSSSTITNSFWDIETSGQETSAGGTGLTTVDMQNQDSFIEWDFGTVWGIAPESYPVLQ